MICDNCGNITFKKVNVIDDDDGILFECELCHCLSNKYGELV